MAGKTWHYVAVPNFHYSKSVKEPFESRQLLEVPYLRKFFCERDKVDVRGKISSTMEALNGPNNWRELDILKRI